MILFTPLDGYIKDTNTIPDKRADQIKWLIGGDLYCFISAY